MAVDVRCRDTSLPVGRLWRLQKRLRRGKPFCMKEFEVPAASASKLPLSWVRDFLQEGNNAGLILAVGAKTLVPAPTDDHHLEDHDHARPSPLRSVRLARAAGAVDAQGHAHLGFVARRSSVRAGKAAPTGVRRATSTRCGAPHDTHSSWRARRPWSRSDRRARHEAAGGLTPPAAEPPRRSWLRDGPGSADAGLGSPRVL